MGEMNPTLFVAAVATALVTVLAAVGGTVVQIINAASGARDRREAAAERLVLRQAQLRTIELSESTGRKADELIQSTTKIHELTNSTNSNLQKTNEVLTEKVAGLMQLIAQMVQARVDTAADHVTTDRQVAAALAAPAPSQARAAAVVPGDPVLQTLEQVADNTKTIADNTAKE